MKVYLASRYSRRAELEGYAQRLKEIGCKVTSRWLIEENYPGGKHPDMSDAVTHRKHAIVDREDILAADVLINFTETEDVLYPRGSRHCEFQLGYEHSKVCILVGPHENIFHHLDGVIRYDTFDEVLKALEQIVRFQRAEWIMKNLYA
jgi:hypothetical protein